MAAILRSYFYMYFFFNCIVNWVISFSGLLPEFSGLVTTSISYANNVNFVSFSVFAFLISFCLTTLAKCLKK